MCRQLARAKRRFANAHPTGTNDRQSPHHPRPDMKARLRAKFQIGTQPTLHLTSKGVLLTIQQSHPPGSTTCLGVAFQKEKGNSLRLRVKLWVVQVLILWGRPVHFRYVQVNSARNVPEVSGRSP